METLHGIRGVATTLVPRLLRKLSAPPGRVFSRSQSIESHYDDYRVVSDRTVDRHVGNLRRKLPERGEDLIESVYGVV